MPYTHETIHINNKKIPIASIVKQTAIPATPFEKSTFGFIAQWLGGEQHFTLHTSGSTGAPKQIQVTRAQLQASAQATLQALHIAEQSQVLICLNTQYIAGIMMLVRSFIGNLYMTLTEPVANPLANVPDTASFDFAAMVPLQADTILREQGMTGLQRIRTLIIGGAPLSTKQRTKLSKADTQIYLTYGMTETLSHIALQQISGTKAADYFTALPGIALQQDEHQCLIIKAPYLSETIVTTDVVEMLSPTTFHWLGRRDHVINSGGVKLHPEQIEKTIGHVLASLEHNNEFFIHGLPDNKLGTKAVLFIETTQPLDQARILRALKAALQPYEVPKNIIETFPFTRTETGKIKREETVQKLRHLNNP